MAAGHKFQLPGQRLYDNILWSDEHFPVENALKLQAYELEPTDVVIASYPKTGTTLLMEIVWLIRNNGDTESANQTLNVMRVPFIELKYEKPHFSFNGFEKFEALPHPRHIKTHQPYKYLPKTVREGTAGKVVYPIRNPKDELVSYYHMHRMSDTMGQFDGTWDDFFQYYQDNDYILCFGNPLDHMLSYWEHRNDDNLFIVFFEDMLKNRRKCVRELADFLGCQLSAETVDKISEATSFKVMKENPMTNMTFAGEDVFRGKFMRKGEIGDWVNHFSEEQSKIVDEMVREKLTGTGLEFQYE